MKNIASVLGEARPYQKYACKYGPGNFILAWVPLYLALLYNGNHAIYRGYYMFDVDICPSDAMSGPGTYMMKEHAFA